MKSQLISFVRVILMMFASLKTCVAFIIPSQRSGFGTNIRSKRGYDLVFQSNISPSRALGRSYVSRSVIPMTQLHTTPTLVSDNASANFSLKGYDWLSQQVTQVLNESFDPSEVAYNAALAKLEPKKKKKKKKKKDPISEESTASTDPKEPTLSQEEKKVICDIAANAAVPFGASDAMVTPATKLEFGDYQCNAAMGLAKHVGLSPRYVKLDYYLASNCRLLKT